MDLIKKIFFTLATRELPANAEELERVRMTAQPIEINASEAQKAVRHAARLQRLFMMRESGRRSPELDKELREYIAKIRGVGLPVPKNAAQASMLVSQLTDGDPDNANDA